MYSSIIFVTFLCTAFAAQSDPFKDCLKEAGIKKLQKSDLQNFKQNPKTRCIPNCVISKAKLISEDGSIDYKLLPTPLQAPLKACYEPLKKTEPCERALKLGSCVVKETVTVAGSTLQTCLTETKTTIDLNKFGLTTLLKIATDKKYACFLRCLAEKMEMVDDKNNLVVNPALKDTLTQFKINVDGAMKKCPSKSTDKCQAVSQKMTCVLKTVVMDVMKMVKKRG